MKKHLGWMVVLSALASSLGACGGTDGSGAGAPSISVGAGGAAGMHGGGGSLAGGTGDARGSAGSAGGTHVTTGGGEGGGGEAGGVVADASTDAANDPVSPDDAGAHSPEGSVRAPDGSSNPYVCSLILGIATTGEWFGDFEKVVDNARWEIKYQDSAHIEKWADPANAVWSLPITSACTQNANSPDRIVFMGVNYDYTTVEEFLPKYIAVLDNIKTKYPSVNHMDVMTYTRAPGDMECLAANRPNDSYIKPAQDDAIAMFAAMYPDFVLPAPKWEVQSCSDFTLCPHLTGSANAVISKTIGAYFLAH